MNKFGWLLVISLLSLGMVQLVGASSVTDEIASRLKPVGSVCVEGQACASGATRVAVATVAAGEAPKAIYDRTCATCHMIGVAGAPKLGDIEAWAPRLDKGMDVLYASGLNGMPPGMPAKGMCFTCSADEIKSVVDYMVQASK